MKRNIIMAIVLGTIATVQDAYAKVLSPHIPDRIFQHCQNCYRLPGLGVAVTNDTPIFPDSNFTWGEATKGGTRIPTDTLFEGRLYTGAEIVGNIIELAQELERLRLEFGSNPILINSWYRPSEVNARTPGAAKNSLHQIGLAADIVILNRSANHVYDRLDRAAWQGGLGRYGNRTHVDLRDRIGRDVARWDG